MSNQSYRTDGTARRHLNPIKSKRITSCANSLLSELHLNHLEPTSATTILPIYYRIIHATITHDIHKPHTYIQKTRFSSVDSQSHFLHPAPLYFRCIPLL
jgi:hypothetical protein